MKFKSPEARSVFEQDLGNAMLAAMDRDRSLLVEAVFEGRQGVHEMTDEDLIETGLTCYGIRPEADWLAGAPFALPVRFDGDLLISATNELIERFYDATPDERNYILKAINSHEALAAVLSAPDLAMDCIEPETAELICAAHQALEGRA